ncbi:murein transglycosylase A [Brackiella oedipodis]|uniref:murein transglycosylase A n=1 Tax=Brackiella oedipodis TaxID=124225 RepID=UPI00048B53E6|nr:MltA domain-containing protein [Brackiella oedipodis]
MKRWQWLLVAGVAGLAACSNHNDTGSSQSAEAAFDLHAPLSVPEPGHFHDTAPRALQGHYQQANWSDLPGWQADDAQNLWLALYNNCKGLMRPVSGSKAIPARAKPLAWQAVCAAVAQKGDQVDAAQAKQFLEDYLQPWQLAGQGLVTGYYEPVVKGSRHQGGEYQWPMYGKPDDLLTIDLGDLYPELVGKRVRGKVVDGKVVPYDSRAEIAKNPNKIPVIAWLHDPVEAFFLQVQGSGRVELDDGSQIRLAYADHNGHPYTSIGKWLAQQGEMSASQASMQNIKAWAQNHPNRVQEMLNANHAMVFFKEEAISDDVAGPKGAYGIPLIAQRAVAVDPNYIPLGTPIFLATTYPASQQALQKVVMAQDTGAAIKGAARVDFFWGSGTKAGEQAGRMKQNSQVWLLWPKDAGAPEAR